MNLFQQLALTAFAVLLVVDLIRLWRGSTGRRAWLARSAIYLATATAIAYPGLTQAVAQAIGIGRGTDVVLYLFVLVLIGVSFYFYSRTADLQRQLTDVVRHLALESARRGDTEQEEDGEPR